MTIFHLSRHPPQNMMILPQNDLLSLTPYQPISDYFMLLILGNALFAHSWLHFCAIVYLFYLILFCKRSYQMRIILNRYIWPIDGTQQLWVSVDPRVKVIKRFVTIYRSYELELLRLMKWRFASALKIEICGHTDAKNSELGGKSKELFLLVGGDEEKE